MPPACFRPIVSLAAAIIGLTGFVGVAACRAPQAGTATATTGSSDPYALMKVVDPDWNGSVPYSMVVAPGGKVLFKGDGALDMLKARRLILSSFPDDDYVGQHAYWNSK